MIRYNNILRPANDPLCEPPAQNMEGSRPPQPPRIDAYDVMLGLLLLSIGLMWILYYYIYIYIFYASRLVFGDDGKYVYSTRLAWLMGTMYETPKVIFEKKLWVEKLTGGLTLLTPEDCGYYFIIYIYLLRVSSGFGGRW